MRSIQAEKKFSVLRLQSCVARQAPGLSGRIGAVA
jgi:hypothetical protein